MSDQKNWSERESLTSDSCKDAPRLMLRTAGEGSISYSTRLMIKPVLFEVLVQKKTTAEAMASGISA